ncbi:MAG: Lrp/AsnC family transcriptional regulator [Chloroflexi bacterium]|nr:Lrp/AsnC family transcriptional regulator [Chloroflexota bacterium]
MYLDSTDRKLLNLMQAEFPLTSEPYAELGLRLGIDGNEVLRRIGQLKTGGFIRQISPIVDARSLGYQTTLVAMRVIEAELDKAERVIGEHPGVSHGYERDHHFNLWFTLAIPPAADIKSELEQLTNSIEAEAIFALPAIKVYKLRTFFDTDEDNQSASDTIAPSDSILSQKINLSRSEKEVINELQQDLPLVIAPFTEMAEHLGMDVEYFLTQCQTLLQRGIIRRFGVAVNHHQIGFTANAMTCWQVPSDMVDAVGQKLAELPEVSHCYERRTNSMWQYNLFAMVHGHSREICHEVANQVSQQTGIADYVELFSTKEFKKVRGKYLV